MKEPTVNLTVFQRLNQTAEKLTKPVKNLPAITVTKAPDATMSPKFDMTAMMKPLDFLTPLKPTPVKRTPPAATSTAPSVPTIQIKSLSTTPPPTTIVPANPMLPHIESASIITPATASQDHISELRDQINRRIRNNNHRAQEMSSNMDRFLKDIAEENTELMELLAISRGGRVL